MHPARLLYLLLFAGLPAHAADGVVLIDQARALAGGITPGDSPGFPVTLSQPGSFRLSGNLAVSDLAVSAIVIASRDVSLDLNGFAISGPNVCAGSGVAMNCTADGMAGTRGHGVDIPDAESTPVAIENGSISGFAGCGILANSGNAQVHRLRASANGQYGIVNAGLVTGSTAVRNGLYGIGNGAAVLNNLASGNRGGSIHGSHIRFNRLDGDTAFNTQID